MGLKELKKLESLARKQAKAIGKASENLAESAELNAQILALFNTAPPEDNSGIASNGRGSSKKNEESAVCA